MDNLHADGKLDNSLSYCDTSFLIELEDSYAEYLSTFCETCGQPKMESVLIRKYWRKNSSRTAKLMAISERLFELESLGLVYSPLCTIEYAEITAKNRILNVLSAELGAKTIHKMNSKELSKIVKAMYDDFVVECESLASPWDNLGPGLFELFPDSYGGWLSMEGVTLVNIENFSLTDPDKIEKLLVLSKFQIGMADIMHLLIAEHIGCTNFLTFDQDFNLAKEEIRALFGLRVIINAEEMAAAL